MKKTKPVNRITATRPRKKATAQPKNNRRVVNSNYRTAR